MNEQMLAPKMLYILEFWNANSNTFHLMVIRCSYKVQIFSIYGSMISIYTSNISVYGTIETVETLLLYYNYCHFTIMIVLFPMSLLRCINSSMYSYEGMSINN